VTYSVQSGIFRPSQSSRLLTIAAAVASGKPLTSILTAAPSSGQLTRAYMRSLCPFIPFLVVLSDRRQRGTGLLTWGFAM